MSTQFNYCQNQIEGQRMCKRMCKIQCDHCKEYYKPLEEEKRIVETYKN